MPATDNWILAQLSENERAQLLQGARQRTLEIGQTIFQPGDAVESVWFPERGVISVITESDTGLQSEAGLSGPETAAGLLECLGSRVMASAGTVQGDGVAWLVSPTACRKLHAESENFRLASHLAVEFHAVEARQSLFCRSYHPTDSRLARWLLEMIDRSANPKGDILLTQDVLAAMLAVQRTTVSTAVAHLRRIGVLAGQRGRVEIRDKPALEALACSCRAALLTEKTRIHAALRTDR